MQVDMTQSPHSDKKTMNQPPTMTKAAILLLATIADTTWRAFVPTIGGTILGIALDNTLHTAPLMTTLLIIVGFVLSTLLIILQIRSVRRQR
jgi:F0F1-type ATP synthase assembly protein I